jgi:hypothetical protein
MIEIYNMGIVHCSVCVPNDMSREEVVAAVNNKSPTGIKNGWLIHSDKFRTGEENPHPCKTDTNRLHYLMVC